MRSFQIFILEKDVLEVFEIFSVLIVGLIIGSFLNMLIYRLPLNISLFNPKRSTCTKCNHTIQFYENIPVVSYILLRGKCSACRSKISIVYPIVEILTAILTLLLYKKLGLNLEFYCLSIVFYFLILLSFIDFEYKAVPNSSLVFVSFLALLYLFFFKIENITTYFIFAGAIVTLELFVSYYIQNIKSVLLKDESLQNQKALGEGDVPIVAIIGGILGLKFGLVAIFLSAILAIIPSILNIVRKKEIETPFIPYLSAALFITYIFENNIATILDKVYIG